MEDDLFCRLDRRFRGERPILNPVGFYNQMYDSILFRGRNPEERFAEGVLYNRTIRLNTLEMISKYSFVAHRSVNYLDLSLREFSSMKEKSKVLVPLLFCSADPAYSKKFVSTSEGCRKTLVPERRWLYTSHLDFAKGRENDILSLKRVDNNPTSNFKTVCVNDLTALDDVYQRSFRSFISLALNQNGMQMNFVRRQIKFMRDILGTRRYHRNSMEDKILNYLVKNCTDSEIVAEFLQVLSMESLIASSPEEHVVEYLLQHAVRARYNLKLNDSQGSLLNDCFFRSRFKFVEMFLKYQNAPYYHGYERSGLMATRIHLTSNDWYPEDLEVPFQKGLWSERRYLLYLQIFHAYTVSNQSLFYSRVERTLRLLWRCVPDAFFTLEETRSAYADAPNSHDITEAVHKFYVASIAEDFKTRTPRRLKHFCRSAVRKALCYNFQLPDGIEELNLPSKLKGYLRLEN